MSVKWLAVNTASEMTCIVSGGALNSTQTNQIRAPTVHYSDRQALSAARFRRAGPSATADACFRQYRRVGENSVVVVIRVTGAVDNSILRNSVDVINTDESDEANKHDNQPCIAPI